MDRVPGDLGYDRITPPDAVDGADEAAAGQAESIPALPLEGRQGLETELVERARERLRVPERLLALTELDCHFDEERRALWTFMRPTGRPSFTPAMLGDFESWQQLIASHFGPGHIGLDFLVLGSRAEGVFCFGGDLELFADLIRARDRAGLTAYGHRCVSILHRNLHALELPMLTIGLVQGQALGGGFEALLSFDVIIAERGSTFGLPEVMFGLFPGMGAHVLLTRKLGVAMAERMILSNRTWTAEQLHELGLVTELAEPGQGVEAVRKFMATTSRRLPGMVNAARASRVAAPVALADLKAVVDLWADAALQLRDADIKLMRRLAATQARNYASAA